MHNVMSFKIRNILNCTKKQLSCTSSYEHVVHCTLFPLNPLRKNLLTVVDILGKDVNFNRELYIIKLTIL